MTQLEAARKNKITPEMELAAKKENVSSEYIKEGITAGIQPGGSNRDFESIEACNEADVAMVFTGERSFKH